LRFDKETRAAIHKASPETVVIDWPSTTEGPVKGKKYRLLKEQTPAVEDPAAPPKVREPETPRCRDVMAEMHKKRHGRYPADYKKPRVKRKSVSGAMRILVEDVQGDAAHGWKATVRLVTDPVQHVRMKAKVPAGPDPLTGVQEPTETEPEGLPLQRSRTERVEEDEALKLEHKASVDRAVAIAAVREARRKAGKKKPGGLAMAAAERAVRRAEWSSAATGA
jgi:hypothetical protein